MHQALLPSESININNNKEKANNTMSYDQQQKSSTATEHKQSSHHQSNKTMSRSTNAVNIGGTAVADDATHIRLLQQVFSAANKSGSLEKKDLTPAVCRTDAMKLWREVLNNNVYNGLKLLTLLSIANMRSYALYTNTTSS